MWRKNFCIRRKQLVYIYFLRKKNSEIFSKFNLVERNIIEFEVLNIILRIVYIRE